MHAHTIARRVVVATAPALFAGIALGVAPADAVTVGGGVIVAVSAPGGHNVEAPFSYDATPVPGGMLVTWNCKALASPDPASTGLGTCSIDGQEAVGSPNNVPGAVSVAAGTVFVQEGAVPVGCIEGHAQFAEGLIGPLVVSTDTKCKSLDLISLATDIA